MKKTTKRKALLLIPIGMFVIAASQVFSHYFALPDFAKGSFVGIGIGLLIIALIYGNFRTAK
ncbi:hypothetical protein FG167_14345 [Lacinutrix sp. WUR7]|uniref:hypothetical protein n=1 Tax=Lacinutrix sp. WUR7 TaxID=2653681 RepID=UPI00193D4691|nr:hypothetical protein [Lacinutrix sp. WUR7]QRM90367.1 hypothetical protein FG167_14345 [Lacinutrix sp. WUR7]